MLMTSAKTCTTSDSISPIPEGKPSSLSASLLIPPYSWKSRGTLLSLTHFRHLTAHFTLMGGFSFSSQCFIISSRTIYSKVRIHLNHLYLGCLGLVRILWVNCTVQLCQASCKKKNLCGDHCGDPESGNMWNESSTVFTLVLAQGAGSL